MSKQKQKNWRRELTYQHNDQSIGVELMIEDLRKETELWKSLYHNELKKNKPSLVQRIKNYYAKEESP